MLIPTASRLILSFVLVSVLVGCASGPVKLDPLPPMLAEDVKPVPPPEVQKPAAERTSADGTDLRGTDAPRSTTVTLPFGAGMTRPSQISGPTPSLPPVAIANYVTGSWVGRCILTADGSVEGCKVLQGLPDSDEHIIQSLQAQKYTPVLFEGKPQRVFYTFKITFK